MKNRECYSCGSNKTYESNWYLNHDNDDNALCSKCNHHLIANVGRSLKWLYYKTKAVILDFYPRTGVCNLCRNVVPFDCKKTERHHFSYHDDDPFRDTLEVCRSCHTKLGWQEKIYTHNQYNHYHKVK